MDLLDGDPAAQQLADLEDAFGRRHPDRRDQERVREILVLHLGGTGGGEIVDLGSHNGTFVNGQLVFRAPVRDLDLIGIGHHQLRLADGRLEEQVDTGEISFESLDLTVHLDVDPARIGPVDVDGLTFRGVFRLLAGDLDRAISDLTASVKLARRGATLTLGLRAYFYLALAQYLAGAWDDVLLTAEATQPMAIVLHELATNASKYGALATPHGRISVRWDWQQDGTTPRRLLLEWSEETHGPAVSAPSQVGYGVRAIRNLIPYELGGTVELVFEASGVRCTMPRARMRPDRPSPDPSVSRTGQRPPRKAPIAIATPSSSRVQPTHWKDGSASSARTSVPIAASVAS